ncbi:MAG: hypothetical protein J6O61_10455 [Butyrivibrio sp.]|uniref:hypothetical protein n=1 Tax=Butyrivibrio sp. TaxID=28121 RepID=UPI001B111E9D|nr:hypothetical protein [Butyrivibrio sp.]MBO6241230.1 hypothetical protein [Butyrivibrio sp.]
MGIKNHDPKNYFMKQSYEKAIDRMEKIDSAGDNAHEKWKEQIISDIIILIIFLALVIFIITR